jgi:hypothetical protein
MMTFLIENFFAGDRRDLFKLKEEQANPLKGRL